MFIIHIRMDYKSLQPLLINYINNSHKAKVVPLIYLSFYEPSTPKKVKKILPLLQNPYIISYLKIVNIVVFYKVIFLMLSMNILCFITK